ncbi:hypothetical protein Bca52824_019257 [Brassica carinata]|uniref:RING-type domain-containing protein n=1 Tax=Brassica carinata TaxID=52824 RepID=A0A8X8AYC5_BRACI|nr:hypothetical protein Bca52824_019257 [Brassica carinata]
MGLGNKVNKFNFGDNDLPDVDGDVEGDGFGSVACSICLDTVVKDGDRAWANLQCGHQFHLDCIGSAFNAKGVMQCPNCRKVEKGQWLYANGCRSHPEFNVEDWVHEDEIYDIGSYSEMAFGVHWCPFGSSAASSLVRVNHDLLNQHGYFTEPAAPTAGHPCPYVTYIGPVHSSSSSSAGAAGVSDSPSFTTHWNTGSSVSSEVPTPYGFPHYHGWEYHSPPPTPPQHFSPSVPHVGSPTHPTPPPASAEPPEPTGQMLSDQDRRSSCVHHIMVTGSNVRTRDRTQALQAYYQQSTAQSHQPDSPIVSRGPVFPSGPRPSRGSASSSSDQSGGGSGFCGLTYGRESLICNRNKLTKLTRWRENHLFGRLPSTKEEGASIRGMAVEDHRER